MGYQRPKKVEDLKHLWDVKDLKKKTNLEHFEDLEES